MKVGAHVCHAMGHVGVVVAVAGPIVKVKFINTTEWVWISDLEVMR